ncbi:MAG: hypothetical protein FJ240_13650 [Nitrospira sp.]|nr:hypothetical protein [Nitrospira sp.]
MNKKTKGHFLSAIESYMTENDLRPADIYKPSKGKVTQTLTHRILAGTAIPDNPEIIDAIAISIGADPKLLRRYAAMDRCSSICSSLKVNKNEVLGISGYAKPHKIPLMKQDKIRHYLSKEGKVNKDAGVFITPVVECGPQAYAVKIVNDDLHPKAERGDICIVDVEEEVDRFDFGVIGTRKDIFFGMIRVYDAFYVVETIQHFTTHNIEKGNALFVHRVVDIMRRKKPKAK